MKFGSVRDITIYALSFSAARMTGSVIEPTEVPRSPQLGADYRRRLDCDTTLPAKVLVTGAELGLSKARDARLSVWAPVWAELPAWRSAEPASDLWTALDDELPSAFPATEATWGEVCLLFLLMLNSWPHDSKKAPLRPQHLNCIFIRAIHLAPQQPTGSNQWPAPRPEFRSFLQAVFQIQTPLRITCCV